MLYVLSRLLCVLLCKVLFRFKVYGRENIPRTGSFILASNHVSFLDPVAVGAASSRKLHFIARHDLFVGLFGKLLSGIDVIPLRREEVDIKAIKEALKILAQGEAIALFPEGKRKFDGNLGPAELGVGFLAEKSRAKIVPAYVEGTILALPPHAKFIRLKKVSVYFGEPLRSDDIITTSRGEKEAYQEIADAVMKKIAQLKERVQ